MTPIASAGSDSSLVVEEANTKVGLGAFYRHAMEYDLLVGDWTIVQESGRQHCLPVGDGLHAVEMAWEGSADEPLAVAVFAAGEVYLTVDHIFVAPNKQGRIHFGDVSPGINTCDGTYSNVVSWVAGEPAEGSCWGELVSNPETGVWEQKCNQNNGKKCTGTLTYGAGPTVITPAWECSGRLDRKISGNSSAGQQTAAINNASSGCSED